MDNEKSTGTNRNHGTARKGGHKLFPVVIIGAGESGIAMGCQLKKVLKCNDFRIFERRGGVGGVWYTNRYPGVACDM
jgi:cation diffusion facilitator CzcD-associated flavoprotein CzcO